MKVDFFIVGAMRSGTSSLRSQLDQDDRILMAKGEPIWFSNDKKFNLGQEEYHKLFDLDKKTNVEIIGEKSPPYAVSELAPKRVYDYNPNAKIIWILRDPVKRAVSHFIHAKFRTSEALSLETAIEDAALLERQRSTMAYVFRSQYEKQLDNWSKYFKNQKVVILEELLDDIEGEMSSIYRYLELEPPNSVEFEKHSKQSIDDGKAKVAKENPVSTSTIEKLREILLPTVEHIENRLGRSLPHWRGLEVR